MRTALTPLDTALADLRAWLPRVTAANRPPADAVGLVAADDVVLEDALPAKAIALTDGIAVLAAGTVGASPQGPIFLADTPRGVKAGEPLPEGTDAVLPAGALDLPGGMPVLQQQAFPGEGARLAGHDLAAGTMLARAGERISPAAALALELAGRREIAVRRTVVRLGIMSPALSAWLARLLAGLGATVAESGEQAHLHVTDRPEGFVSRRAGLALSPGHCTAIGMFGTEPAILLPRRFDGAVAAAVALLPPALASLSGSTIPLTIGALAARLTSQAGIAEIALLSLGPEGFRPLATGEVTLAALLAASHAAMVPAESEGMPARERLAALPLPGTPFRT